MKKKYNCIGLLAREHGFETLKKLYQHPEFEVIAVFTHEFEAKEYSIEKKEREDYKEFVGTTKKNNTQLYTINKIKENSKLNEFIKVNPEFDFLVSISWRYLIPYEIFGKAKISSFNIHRGDLPKYAGKEPIKRALENNEKEIFICSHKLNEKFDDGELICKAAHPVNYNSSKSLEENIKRLKKEITPYFPEIAFKSFEILINNIKKKGV